MRFSINIPFQSHRSCALDCIRAWLATQKLPRRDYEIVAVLPVAAGLGLQAVCGDSRQPPSRPAVDQDRNRIARLTAEPIDINTFSEHSMERASGALR